MEKITYIHPGAFRGKSAVVRKNRTIEETKAQASRLVILAMETTGDLHMNRIFDTKGRVEKALEADGRKRFGVLHGVKLVCKETI